MKETKKRPIKAIIWSAIGGAVVTMIIGFAWGGWVLGSTAERDGREMADQAVIERLADICVGQFNEDKGKDMKVKELMAASSWGKGDFVKSQGWALIPFEERTDDRVAKQCAEQIIAMNE
jgi:hypothetical protein